MEVGMPRLVCLIFVLMLLAEATDAATLNVSTTAVFPAIPSWKQEDDFEVLVRVEAPPAAKRRAGPMIDLVAVLDVSSSMNAQAAAAGDKLSRLDLLKKAMKFVIAKLDDGDRLAVVAFNDELVEEYGTDLMYMAGGGRRDARRHVDALMAHGNTAFRPGLEKAVKILDERSADCNRAGFIVLLSDGIDNSEMEWSKESMSKMSKLGAALRRYPVHAFGFSAAHDPSALLFIAQESRGTYSFVNEGLDRITAAFAVCLGGLRTVVAADARVRLTAAGEGRGGVRIRSVESGGYRSHVSCDGTSGEIVIGALYAGEVKNFIVRLRVPSVEEGTAVFEELLLTAAAVDLVEDGGHRQSLSVQRTRGGLGSSGAPAPSAAVVNHVLRFRLVEIVARFVRDELHLHDYAIDRRRAEELGRKLQSMWEEFKEGHKFWSGADMASLEKDVGAMVSGLRRGADDGVAYICSWVSSYQMQRATTMGSPDKVTVEFFTPEMRQMMLESTQTDQSTTAPPTETEQGGPADAPAPPVDMIDRRLELWSRLKREVPLMFQQAAAPDQQQDDAAGHLTAMFRDASLEAIDRAMHRDVYLAVVHASNLRRRSCCSGHHVVATEEAAAGHVESY